ncbi:hypothetical protein [Streptomyces sp. NPDC003278]|uniref:hypothetical protein n=1 Tax=Streptomyces sp. NPDC003278 TaxID=3364679 RepID=UPI003689628E
MSRARRRPGRADRRTDITAPAVPGQLTVPDDADRTARAAVQMPLFAIAGGTYWKAWRT